MFHPIMMAHNFFTRIQYALELDKTLHNLESELHESDDPDRIIHHALEVACKFYGADWAGFLDVDLELRLWTPFMWYNQASEDKTTQLLQEYESMDEFDQWTDAMDKNHALIIPDTEATKEMYPQEYKMYKRLQAHSVLAVPVKPRPVGFLVLRNPTRYITHSSMLQNLAFVVLAIGNEKRLLDGIKASWSPAEIQDENDIVLHFFGEFSIHTSHGVLRESEINSPGICQLITYLFLHPNRAISTRELAGALNPEEAIDQDNPGENIKYLVYRLRHHYVVLEGISLIDTTVNGYTLNHKLRITTDLDQFNQCINAAHETTSITWKIHLLEHAIEIYKGSIFPSAASNVWLVPTVAHYQLEYLKVIDELLELLAGLRDYSRVHYYATESLKLEPGHVSSHFWLINASYQQGSAQIAKLELQRAAQVLTEEEYADLVESLKEVRLLHGEFAAKSTP